MRAVSLHGPRDLRLEPYAEESEPGPGEIRIRVMAVGICGSDLHLYQEGQIGGLGDQEPFVPGHEFMGEVCEVGAYALDGVRLPLQLGDRVAVDPHLACGECEWCEAGHPNLCPRHDFIGLPPMHGALRETMIVPARACFHLTEDMTAGTGALLEPLGVALHAMDLTKARIGQSAVVLGCGPIGLMMVRLAALQGLHPIIAVDPLGWRIEQARLWGAHHGIVAPATEAIEKVMDATEGRGVDQVIEAAWAGSAVDAGVEMACPGARVTIIGIPRGHELQINHSTARRKGLTLAMVRRMKHVYPRAIALAQGPQPQVPLDDLISHTYSLEEASTAFEQNSAYLDHALKFVIHPQR